MSIQTKFTHAFEKFILACRSLFTPNVGSALTGLANTVAILDAAVDQHRKAADRAAGAAAGSYARQFEAERAEKVHRQELDKLFDHHTDEADRAVRVKARIEELLK